MEAVQERLGKLDAGFKQWLRQQSAPVEVAIVTAGGAAQGGAIGGLMGRLTADAAAGAPPMGNQLPQTNPQMMVCNLNFQAFAGGPWAQARNFAVMSGVNSGLTCVMKRLRGGVEDAQTSMVAGFGSGACLSIASGIGGENPVASAVTTGLSFGLIQAAMFKVTQKFYQPPGDDIQYLRSKNMLRVLGLEKYEKNFKKGYLTDETLPLLTDSALRDVKIPPGPRLLILHHIERSGRGHIV
ncbi:hypothetical protein SELMODRAFT_85831 [Selaginella moellendorffii]|uniref:SAM domain-containing protein n=1 Tax=Selaginella moellendorffii TaxID=88036 RepID=D8R5D0_SELML|nr:hypothetical protein SELMODRAFT_85831 [Selaginella moellendorffii]